MEFAFLLGGFCDSLLVCVCVFQTSPCLFGTSPHTLCSIFGAVGSTSAQLTSRKNWCTMAMAAEDSLFKVRFLFLMPLNTDRRLHLESKPRLGLCRYLAWTICRFYTL